MISGYMYTFTLVLLLELIISSGRCIVYNSLPTVEQSIESLYIIRKHLTSSKDVQRMVNDLVISALFDCKHHCTIDWGTPVKGAWSLLCSSCRTCTFHQYGVSKSETFCGCFQKA